MTPRPPSKSEYKEEDTRKRLIFIRTDSKQENMYRNRLRLNKVSINHISPQDVPVSIPEPHHPAAIRELDVKV
jgi:hypothetical protein